jgi:hypothetical protein
MHVTPCGSSSLALAARHSLDRRASFALRLARLVVPVLYDPQILTETAGPHVEPSITTHPWIFILGRSLQKSTNMNANPDQGFLSDAEYDSAADSDYDDAAYEHEPNQGAQPNIVQQFAMQQDPENAISGMGVKSLWFAGINIDFYNVL